jgi:hypothetical protein
MRPQRPPGQKSMRSNRNGSGTSIGLAIKLREKAAAMDRYLLHEGFRRYHV